MQIRRRDASKQTRNLSRAQDVEMPARLTIRACAAGEARLMKQGWPEFGMLTISGKTQPAPGPGGVRPKALSAWRLSIEF